MEKTEEHLFYHFLWKIYFSAIHLGADAWVMLNDDTYGKKNLHAIYDDW